MFEKYMIKNFPNLFDNYHEEMMKRKRDFENKWEANDSSMNSKTEEYKKETYSKSSVHMKEWIRDIYNINYFT